MMCVSVQRSSVLIMEEWGSHTCIRPCTLWCEIISVFLKNANTLDSFHFYWLSGKKRAFLSLHAHIIELTQAHLWTLPQIPCLLYTPSCQISTVILAQAALLIWGSSKPKGNASSASRLLSTRGQGLASACTDSLQLSSCQVHCDQGIWGTARVGVTSREANARQAGGGEQAGYLLGCQLGWRGDCLHATGSRTSGSFRGADAQPKPPPGSGHQSASLGVLRASAQARASQPPSLPTGGDVGDVVVTSSPESEPLALWRDVSKPWWSWLPLSLLWWPRHKNRGEMRAGTPRLHYVLILMVIFSRFPLCRLPPSERDLRMLFLVSFQNPVTSSSTTTHTRTYQRFVVNGKSRCYFSCPGNPPALHTGLRLTYLSYTNPRCWPRCQSPKLNLQWSCNKTTPRP